MQRIGRGLAGLSLAVAAAVVGAGAVTGQPVSESEALEKTRIRSTDDFQAKDAGAVDPTTAPGKAIFAEHCAVCHEGGVPKAPSPTFLAMMPGDAIVAALTDGVMKVQGSALSPAQRVEVAEFVTRRRLSGRPSRSCHRSARGRSSPSMPRTRPVPWAGGMTIAVSSRPIWRSFPRPTCRG
ncbi:c-type cytochrome [Rhizorhabdus histidinilytica]